MNAETYLKQMMARSWERFEKKNKDKQKKKLMKKLYKIGGWTCLLVGFGCLWGIGAVAVFSGLTLFWFGATIDDAKCY